MHLYVWIYLIEKLNVLHLIAKIPYKKSETKQVHILVHYYYDRARCYTNESEREREILISDNSSWTSQHIFRVKVKLKFQFWFDRSTNNSKPMILLSKNGDSYQCDIEYS